MDTQTAFPTARRLGFPILLMACCLPWQAQAQSAIAQPMAGYSVTTVASAAPARSRAQHRKPTRMSKATLSVLQPSVGQHLNTEPLPAAGSVAAAMLSPVVQRSSDAAAANADPLPTVGMDAQADSPLAKLLEPDVAEKKVSNKNRPLPSQEEGLALAKSTRMPRSDSGEGVSEEAQSKVEKGVESGPMRVRVKKQALQMSVEFPMFQ